MSAAALHDPEAQTNAPRIPQPTQRAALIAALAGLATLWPLLFAALLHGPQVLTRGLIGDSYHYLVIARKAALSGIYTYDGVHVTNGFHPLWEYSIRGMFQLFRLTTHESQAIAVMLLGLVSVTVGVMLASSAIVRITGQAFPGLLVVPGLYYLLVGVSVSNLPIWAQIIGMESSYSTLFGGLFFFILSHFVGVSAPAPFNTVRAFRALGLVLPLIILSRLDDVFLLPAFLVALFVFESERQKRLAAALWITLPSAFLILLYLLYNKLTVGAAMPLSGATKSGFVGAVAAYLTASVLFAPLLEFKARLTHSTADGAAVFSNSFRFIEVIFPLVIAAFAAWGLWRTRRAQRALLWFALSLYIVFKLGYNFAMVHPWHQAGWYYGFIMLSLSVMGAVALAPAWRSLSRIPRHGVITVYAMLMLLAGSQFYASIVYQPASDPSLQFWARQEQIRQALAANGVHGLLNVDDGISAFLLDLPALHGFAFATDVEAQKAHQQGRMLTLAYARNINCIAGFNYLTADIPPRTDAEIRQYLAKSLAGEIMRNDAANFHFTLAYYDPALKMPFFTFAPR